MRRTAISVIAWVVTFVLVPLVRAADPPPPNILFIMADDYPWSFYGKLRSLEGEAPPGSTHPLTHPRYPLPSQFETPGLDALANRGAFFPLGHSGAPLCHPSFQATLTGLYEKDFLRGRFSRPLGVSPYYVVEYLNAALDRHDRIKADGPPPVEYRYRSLGFGKIWTIGGFRAAGFDFGWSAKLDGRATITPIIEFIKANTGRPQDAYDTFCKLKHSECAVHQGQRPDPSQPWFVWYAPNLPHHPTDALRRTRTRVEAVGRCNPHDHAGNCIELPETDPNGTELAGVLDRMETLDTTGLEHNAYLQNILLLDYWVGQLLDYVAANAPNTIIVYQADNGWLFPRSKKDNAENAFRTPIMMSWPGIITAGVRDQLVSALDFIPTLVDYSTGHTFLQCAPGTSPVTAADGTSMPFPPITGCAAGQQATCGCFEGQSMRRLLETAAPGRDWLIGMTARDSAYLRTKDGWRLTRKDDTCRFELYDLRGNPPTVPPDPDETNDCLRHVGAPCREDFRGQNYAAGTCAAVPGSRCAQVKAWQCALKQWHNPGGCTFSCD